MAHFTIEYFSAALQRRTAFQAWIPNDAMMLPGMAESKSWQRPMKTLFTLHGYTGMAESWFPEDVAARYNIAVVAPTAENSFYLDAEAAGHQFETMVAIELVDYMRKTFGLAMKPEDTYIAGISMGGFGAVHTGLAHPDRFGKIGMLSAAMIIYDIAGMTRESDTSKVLGNYAYYEGCFGDLQTVAERDTNPEVLIRKLKAAGTPIPPIFQCIGTEDFLLEHNRRFHKFLTEEGVAHEYRESKGTHDNVFWTEYKPKMLEWMFQDEI